MTTTQESREDRPTATAPRAVRRRSMLRRLVPLVVVVIALVAMVLDTKFLSAKDAGALNPAAFNAKSYASKEFVKITQQFDSDATPLAQLAPAVTKDAAAAAQRYKGKTFSGKYAFATTIKAPVKSVDANFMLLDTPRLGKNVEVRVPLGIPVNGTPVRDASGLEFRDFTDQTDYQQVANEFKLLIQRNVLSKVETKGLKGKTVEVTGAYETGGPEGSFIIQPTSLKVTG